MSLDVGLALGIGIPLLSWAVQWGSMRTMSRVVGERLDRLERSIENFGARLGALENEMAAQRAVAEYSRPHHIGGK